LNIGKIPKYSKLEVG